MGKKAIGKKVVRVCWCDESKHSATNTSARRAALENAKVRNLTHYSVSHDSIAFLTQPVLLQKSLIKTRKSDIRRACICDRFFRP